MQKQQLSPIQQKVYDYFIGDGVYNLSRTARYFHKSYSHTHDILSRLVGKGWLVNDKWQKPAYRPTDNKISEFARGYQLGYKKGLEERK